MTFFLVKYSLLCKNYSSFLNICTNRNQSHKTFHFGVKKQYLIKISNSSVALFKSKTLQRSSRESTPVNYSPIDCWKSAIYQATLEMKLKSKLRLNHSNRAYFTPKKFYYIGSSFSIMFSVHSKSLLISMATEKR